MSFINDSGVIVDDSLSPARRWLKEDLLIEQYAQVIRFTGIADDERQRIEYEFANETAAIREYEILYEYLEDYGGGGGGLTTVAVDGVTITGDGTVGNPLVSHAAGGANLWAYKAKTTITTGDPTPTHLIWDNATQVSATQINLSHLTEDGFDVDLFFGYIVTGDKIIIQDRDDSANFQIWIVSSAPTIIPNSYIEIPVTLDSSGGTGTTNFANNDKLLVAKFGGVVPTLEIEQDGVSVESDTHKINVIYPIVATSAGANTVALQVDTNSVLNNIMLEVARFNGSGTDHRAMVYVESVNKLYVRQGSFLRIYDCDTYELLATISGGTVAVDYIPSANEVWAQGTTTNTQRIDINTNTLIANIAGTIATKSKFIEYTNAAGTNTSAYGFVQANITGFTKINTTSFAVTTLNWSSGVSRVWAALCLNPASAMHRHIVVTSSNGSGLDIWDAEADTEVAINVNPSGVWANPAGNRGIEYSTSLDCFIVANITNNIVAYLQPATTSTFTVVRIIRTMQAPSFIVIDETNGLLLVSHNTIPTGVCYVSKFRLSDGKPLGIVSTGSIFSAVTSSAYMGKKGTQSTLFVSGNNTTQLTPISEVKYL